MKKNTILLIRLFDFNCKEQYLLGRRLTKHLPLKQYLLNALCITNKYLMIFNSFASTEAIRVYSRRNMMVLIMII